MTIRIDVVSATTLLPDSGTVTRLMTSVTALRAGAEVDIHITALESPRLLARRELVSHRRAAIEATGASISFRPLAPQCLPGGRMTMVRLAGLAVAPALAARRPHAVFAVNADAAAACAQAPLGRAGSAMNVLEMHGIESEESIAAGVLRRTTPAHETRRHIERVALRWAHDVVAPTAEACDWGRQLSATPTRWHALPTLSPLRLTDGERRQLRAASRCRLGWQDKKVILYLGGMNSWQQPELMASVFASLHAHDEDWRFLVLTPDCEQVERLLRRSSVPRESFRAMSVSHDQVAEHATAGDVALLLRRQHLMNRVASPTKFGEYLELGVPVCITDAVPSMSELTNAHGLGVVVDHDASGDEVASRIGRFTADTDRTIVAARCRAAAAAHFAAGRAEILYRDILETAAQGVLS